jgi:diguanylate cyclase (GGDEF)-like protein
LQAQLVDNGMRVVKPDKKHSTAFVTAPIAALAVAAFAVVLASLVIGARETDKIALTRQRETIAHALSQHGQALARELRAQTIWSEAYERTLTRDQAWMRDFYGKYLSQLFGYDRIYILSAQDRPIYAFVNGRETRTTTYGRVARSLHGLVAAARNKNGAPLDSEIITKSVSLGNGKFTEHRTAFGVANFAGTPATAVVSTIVPDRPPKTPLGSSPFLLVAIEDLDHRFIKQLGTTFELRDLEWLNGRPTTRQSTMALAGIDGAAVGTLAWLKNHPGWQFAKQVAIGLGIALVLLAALALILMRWGKSQARQLVDSEEEARQAARTDALTGLPNRVALGTLFQKMLAKARQRSVPLAVLLVDIDQFKEINDDFGHAVGDAVLLNAGKRLQGLVRKGSVLVRPDGDEFMILALGADAEGAAALAERITSALAEPITINGDLKVFAPASVGYAIAPQDGEHPDDLVRRVELALAKAKAAGTGSAMAFAPEMDLELSRRRMLESALRQALVNESIAVVYQPIMDKHGQHILAVEALARWTDPMLGPISPEVFVPLAEETGLIQRIGEIVLRRAVADGCAWPEIDVAVNVSAAQVYHGDVVATVREILCDSGFPPERLEIEITETVLLADEKRADGQIRALQDMGVKVALDDFGSGYSSLMYLRKFGFDNLKIDRSFIEDIGKSPESAVVLESVIQLGLDLHLRITAEGIETVAQHQWLETSGCHRLQGYLFSRPLAAEQLSAFIARHRRKSASGSTM